MNPEVLDLWIPIFFGVMDYSNQLLEQLFLSALVQYMTKTVTKEKQQVDWKSGFSYDCVIHLVIYTANSLNLISLLSKSYNIGILIKNFLDGATFWFGLSHLGCVQ